MASSKAIKMTARQRKARRIRKRISGSDIRPRVSVSRSDRHIYAQIISDESHATLASASTLEDAVLKELGSLDIKGCTSESRSTKSTAAARAVGVVLARRVAEKDISEVVFDRNGYIYQGRVQALADGLRAGGLKF